MSSVQSFASRLQVVYGTPPTPEKTPQTPAEEFERGYAEGWLSAHAVTTLHYLNAKSVGIRMATETTEALLSVFEVAPVDEAVLRSAVSLKWQDFEDAVTAAGARRAKCDAVVTRNPRDFKGAALRILTPTEAVAWIETSS